jgi:hypothetical protein
MPFRDAPYGPVTIAVMTSAFEAAWQEARARDPTKGPDDANRATMVSAIIAAVANGERLPLRLRDLALRAVDPEVAS